VRFGRPRPACEALLLIGIILGGAILSILPNLAYAREHGRNREVARRVPMEAELFGLKLDQLVLPIPNHRLTPFARLNRRYETGRPLINENRCAALGLFGAFGFVCLTLRLVYWTRGGGSPEVIDGLTVFNGAGLLTATVGGFGALFNLLVIAEIRAQNRISIWLAFLAVFFTTAVLQRALLRLVRRTGGGRTAVLAAAGVITVAAVLDQTPPGPLQSRSGPAFRHDAAFFAGVQAEYPAGAMIFQLPYSDFPETVPVGDMGHYDHARAILLAPNLRWSYGAVKGRSVARRQAELAAMRYSQMVRELILSGFDAICIDRHGYADRAEVLEFELRRLTGEPPTVSPDRRMSVFDLRPFAAEWRATIDEADWRRLCREARDAFQAP
jgi:phosphoglycerol transferase